MKKVLFILSFVFLLASCHDWQSLGKFDSNLDEGNEGTYVLQQDQLFVENAENNNEYTFSTNNKNFVSSTGSTFFTTKFFCNQGTLSVDVKKFTGSETAGYGIVFARKHKTSSEYNEDEHDQMYVFMINNSQSYLFGKVTDSVFTELTEQKKWIQTNVISLSTGYRQNLKVEESENKSGRLVFKIYINGTYVDEFIADEGVKMSNSYYGLVAVISPYENYSSSQTKIVYTLN